jgi:hypothetical protein
VTHTRRNQQGTNLKALRIPHSQYRLGHLALHGFLHAAPSDWSQTFGAKRWQKLLGLLSKPRGSSRFQVTVLLILLLLVPLSKRHGAVLVAAPVKRTHFANQTMIYLYL